MENKAEYDSHSSQKKPPVSAFNLLHTKALEKDLSKENIGIVSAKDMPL